MSKSNWKGSERKAAKLFPGGSRRLRMGAFSSMVSADDIRLEWCKEIKIGNRIVKVPRVSAKPGVYVDVKKKATTSLVTGFDAMEEKYCTSKYGGRMILITHKKGDSRQLVTMADEFFKEMFDAWHTRHISEHRRV